MSTLQAVKDHWLQVSRCYEGMPGHPCEDRIIFEATMQARAMNNYCWHAIAQAAAVSH